MEPWQTTEINKRFFESFAQDQPINEGYGPEQALPLIESLVSMWEYAMPNLTQTRDMPVIDQDVTGRLSDMILQAVRQPMIFRMSFIKQLSTTFLSTGLGGTHTRLAHSLGTTLIAQKFLHTITESGVALEQYEKDTVLILALIHDAYHGPFGHVLDRLKGLLFPRVWSKLDKYSLALELRQEKKDGELMQLFKTIIPDQEQRNKVIEYMQLFLTKRKLKESYPEKYFLAQIVDSRFDADRLDFIHRDSRHLGETPDLHSMDLQRMIERVRVVKDPEDGEISTLAYAEEDKDYLERTILGRRRTLYEKYYENPDRIAADEMLAHLIYYILGEPGLKVIPRKEGVNAKTEQKLFDDLLRLTDDQLFSFLHCVPKPLYCVNLLTELLTGHLYRSIASLPVEYSLQASLPFIYKLDKAWEKRLSKKPVETIGVEDIGIMLDEYKNVFSKATQNVRFVEMVGFYYGDFQNQIKLERILWDHLLSQVKFRKFFEDTYHIQRFGSLEDAISKVSDHWNNDLIDYPHVHIALPSYMTLEVDEQKEYATEETVETTLWHKDGTYTRSGFDTPTREQIHHHKVVISCPPEFVEDHEVVDLIKKSFDTIVKEFKWATNALVKHQVSQSTLAKARGSTGK